VNLSPVSDDSLIKGCLSWEKSMRRHIASGVALAIVLLASGIAHAQVPASSAARPAAVSPSASAGTKRALLIGINNYKAVPHLMGSLNDVAAIQQILITRWGFEPGNIKTLTEQAATRAAILAALRELVHAAGPSDTVFVHFSGHGSQVQDLDGDEDDGLDETLVPYDGRTPGVPDIVDDELDRIFAGLHAGATLIVLDSCHSGTATRALDFRTRGIPQDMRIGLYEDTVGATKTRAIVPRVESRFLVMSAVAENEEALDGPIDGEYHGIFTYALSRSLAVSPPGASPRDVFARVSEEMKRLQTRFGRTAMPEPQLEGPPVLLDRALLTVPNSGGTVSGSSRLAWLEVQPAPAGQVLLVQGALLGAASGSTWAIYPPGETTFAPGRAIAVATAADSVGLDVRASLRAPAARVEPGSRAVVLMPAPGDARVPIRILDVPAEQRRQIEDVLNRTIRNVDLVGPERPARFLIEVQGNSLRLLAADGRQVVATFDARTDQWGGAVARLIARSAHASELLALDNPASQISVRAQVVGNAPQTTRDIVLVADTRPAQLHIRRPDEARATQNSLQIAVTVSTDAYLTVVDVDSDGNANLLFPNSYQRPDFYPDGRVPGNQPLMIPDSLSAGSRAGFFWDYGPPAGIDTIRIFASTDVNTARLIRERIRALQSAPSGTRGLTSGGSVSEALGGLHQDLAGLATRGIVTLQDSAPAGGPPAGSAAAPDWAAASVTVAIAE
jgi:uncharacterized caspase-like protein